MVMWSTIPQPFLKVTKEYSLVKVIKRSLPHSDMAGFDVRKNFENSCWQKII
jgi:hypothetical protein